MLVTANREPPNKDDIAACCRLYARVGETGRALRLLEEEQQLRRHNRPAYEALAANIGGDKDTALKLGKVTLLANSSTVRHACLAADDADQYATSASGKASH